MPDEQDQKSSVVDFLNNIDEPFKEKEVVEETTTETEEDEKPVPFHKDPKVQRYVEKQIEKALKDVKPVEVQRQNTDDIKLPASFVKLIGNDTEEKVQVLKDLSDYFGTLKGEARQEFLKEMQEQAAAETQAEKEAVDELFNGFEAIEEQYDVDLTSNSATAQKTQDAFKAYLKKISPKDANGEVIAFADIPAAWESFQDTLKPSNSRAKQLASRGMARSTDAETELPKGRSWKDVDRFFSKLPNN